MSVRTFQISSKLFWGFKVNLNINEFFSNEQIVNTVISMLRNILTTNNLIDLLESLDGGNNKQKMDFHIHDKSYVDILNSKSDEIFYVCCHD